MLLAYSTNAYLQFPAIEAIRRVARLGYQGVELMADVPHAWPAHLLAADKHAIHGAIRETGLAISNINAFMMRAVSDARQAYWHPSWIEPDPHYRRIRVEHTVRCLDLARELGAPSITTEPGGPVPPGLTWGASLTRFVEELKPVAEHAERTGIALLVEPEPGLLIENSDQFEELMARVDSPAVSLNFDIGHFYCVGEDPAAAVRKLARYIRHFHVEDIAATRVHQHLVPGEGAIDFDSAFAAMRAIGYAGWVTVELYPYINSPDEAGAAARRFLLAKLGHP